MTEEQPSAPVAWDHIRLRYEQAQETVAQIAASINMSGISLSRYAKAQGWALRTPKTTKAETTRETLRRLKDILQKRLAHLEGQIGEIGQEINALSNERDMKSANLLVRTLEKVLELEHKERKQRSSRARETRALNDAERDELARRIDALGTEAERQSDQLGSGGGSEASLAMGLDDLGKTGPAAA